MTKLKLVTLIIFLLNIIVGCSHVESYLDVAKDRGISREYLDILNRWTKKETLYSQFETKVQISATLKSGAFNMAYTDEYARVYYLTVEEIKRREDMQSGFARDFTEFFFYASMSRKEANDFDRPNSSWAIFLVDEKGHRTAPLEVRKIEKITPLMEEFFPFINQYYGICYSLKFPPPPSVADRATPVDMPWPTKLIFSSVLGKIELIWP